MIALWVTVLKKKIIFILLIDVYLYRLLGLFITINGTEKSNNKPDSSNTLEVKVGFVESFFLFNSWTIVW